MLILTVTLLVDEIISQRRESRLSNWACVILYRYVDYTVIQSEAASHTAQRLGIPVQAQVSASIQVLKLS